MWTGRLPRKPRHGVRVTYRDGERDRSFTALGIGAGPLPCVPSPRAGQALPVSQLPASPGRCSDLRTYVQKDVVTLRPQVRGFPQKASAPAPPPVLVGAAPMPATYVSLVALRT